MAINSKTRGVTPLITPSFTEMNTTYIPTFNAGGSCKIPILLDTSASLNETLYLYNSIGGIDWSILPSNLGYNNTTNPFASITYDDVTQTIYVILRSVSRIFKITSTGSFTSILVTGSPGFFGGDAGSMLIDPISGNIEIFTRYNHTIISPTGALISVDSAVDNGRFLRYKTDLDVYVGIIKNIDEFTGQPMAIGKKLLNGKISLIDIGPLLNMSAYPYVTPNNNISTFIYYVEIMQWGQDLLFTNRTPVSNTGRTQLINKAEFDAGINQLATNLGLI